MLLKTLKDMHAHEEAFMFHNREGDMTCMLRSTSEKTDELMTFDLVIIYDAAKDVHGKFKRAMTMEYTVLEDEDEDFVIDTITVSKDATPQDMDDAVESINKVFEMCMCECYENLVKSTALGVCYVCAICGDDPDDGTPVDTCVICVEEIHTDRGAVRMNCCDQAMHRKCHERWRSEEATRNCPVCRK